MTLADWEEDFPTYRVYFFTDPGPGSRGWTSDEHEISQAPDVRTVIEWADEQAAGRTYILYALVHGRPAKSGLRTLMGHDPNRPKDPRRPDDLK